MSPEPVTLNRLRREYVLNPITALAFYTSADGQQYLLAGEDTDVSIYHVQTSRFCGRLSVFQAQSIHGISVPPVDASRKHRLILIWGGHTVGILPQDVIEGLITGGSGEPDSRREIPETKAPDWIFDGRISPFADNHIVLLTAHNEVIQAHADPDRGLLIFDRIQSPSRPILYSGNFFWVSNEYVLVAAGTVFGEILVWKCYLEAPEREHNCKVLFVFTGHEGSVFGVHISSEILTSEGETRRLLASCSDDRTIRIWDITERRDESGQKRDGDESRISDARETGFGNNTEATAHEYSARCLATAMGHASRIWQVEFPQDQALSRSSDIVELYSFGEDATAQKWNLALNPRPPGSNASNSASSGPSAQLTHQSTYSNHSGKHIWSHSMTSKGRDIIIATGGSDGKIALIGAGVKHISQRVTDGGQSEPTDGSLGERKATVWSLTDVLQTTNRNQEAMEARELGISGVSTSSPRSAKPKNAKEAFNRYTFISDKRLLAATNSGRVFIGAFEDEVTWTELALPDEIGQIVFSHALLGASGTNPPALVGTNDGDVYYYSESGSGSLQPLTKVNGKVADIFCLSDTSTTRGGGHVEFLATILRSANAVLLQFGPDTSTLKQTEVVLEPGFMVTAASYTQGYLVLGSRKGVIAVLKEDESGKYSAIFSVEVHRDEAITSILPLRNKGDQPRIYILSTCRDGKYRIHEILATVSLPGAVLVHETLPPFVSSVEGAWFSDNGDETKDLMLCGFKSKNFVVWNETQRHEVATVDCGGSSRSYAWAPIRDQHDGFRFAFTKAGQMHVFSQTIAHHRTLKAGGHGREIKAVSASTGRYIATAAEDTVIRIWEYSDYHHQRNACAGSDTKLRCVAALEKHATGIQALKWYRNEYLFSSGGNEEFFVWKINQLESSDFSGLAVVCEAVFPDRSEVGDARITDFDVACAASASDEGCEFVISMALSNSTLQTYAYSRDAGFRLLRRTTYTGACLTQIRHLGEGHILTAATDGHLAIYPGTARDADGGNTTDTPAGLFVTRLHQNSIKSLDVRQVATTDSGSASEYFVVTGGDDNALGFTHISLPASSSCLGIRGDAVGITIKSKSIVRSAHAAAVTGVSIAHVAEDAAMVVTGSNDQRVRVWRLAGWYQREQQQIRAQLLDEQYSSVADAGDLEIFQGGNGEEKREEGRGKEKVIVVGVGIEIWELEV